MLTLAQADVFAGVCVDALFGVPIEGSLSMARASSCYLRCLARFTGLYLAAWARGARRRFRAGLRPGGSYMGTVGAWKWGDCLTLYLLHWDPWAFERTASGGIAASFRLREAEAEKAACSAADRAREDAFPAVPYDHPDWDVPGFWAPNGETPAELEDSWMSKEAS